MDTASERSDSAQYLGAASVLATIVTVEAIRVFITLDYGLRENAGTIAAGGLALVVFAAPFSAAFARRILGDAGTLGATVCLAAVGAILIQVVHPIPVWIAAVTTSLGLVALTMLLHAHRAESSARGAEFAMAVMLGLTIDTGMQAVFVTWSPLWRTWGIAVLITFILVMILLSSIPGLMTEFEGKSARSNREGTFKSTLPILVLGPFLMLELSFTQNISFVDAAYGTSVGVGSVLVLIADFGAITVMLWGGLNRSIAARRVLAIVVVVMSWLMTCVTGIGGVIVLVCVGVALGPLLAAALSCGEEPARSAAWRTATAVGLGMTLFAALSLAFQLDITNPLPFSGRWVPVGASVLVLAFATWPVRGSAPRLPRLPWRLAAIPAALAMAVPLVISVGGGAPAMAEGNGTTLRVLDWNVHSMVNAVGMLDPEVIAAVIEAQQVDVVTLQEVTRGWLIAGSTDEAEWLARRLRMQYAWSPAADSEFGNLLLSRYPIVSSDAVQLPYVDGPQHRSFVAADIDIGGTVVRVIDAHLESNTARTHRAQVETMLAYAGSQEPTIIAGDMNMQPADPDAPLFALAGFGSAQDVTGNGARSSATKPNFAGDRVDWIFGTKDVAFGDFGIVESDASDHLPLVVTATVPR